MRALTFPQMMSGWLDVKPDVFTNPRHLPENLKNNELKRKLCFGTAEKCKSCVNLDVCRFGQQAMERGMT